MIVGCIGLGLNIISAAFVHGQSPSDPTSHPRERHTDVLQQNTTATITLTDTATNMAKPIATTMSMRMTTARRPW